MKLLHTLAWMSASTLLLVSCVSKDITQSEEQAQTPSVVPASAVPGRVVVKISEEFRDSHDFIQSLSQEGSYEVHRMFPEAGKFEARHRAYGFDLWYVLEFDQNQPLTKAHDELSGIEGVDLVEYSYDIRPTALPFNDPRLGEQWHYNNDGSLSGSVPGSDMNVFKAWELTTGSPNVIVAVCDQGVEYDHEDLAANMWRNTAELNGQEGVDDDGNGYVDDFYGYNFTVKEGTNNQMAGAIVPGNHGTHVAGTIAAVNNNAKGVGGIAGGDGSADSGVRIMGIQTMEGSAYISAGIVYAADQGAVLINCSWEIPEVTSTPSHLISAFEYFNQVAGFDEHGNQVGPMAGGLVIFAAGNDNTTASYPAKEESVVAIASIGADFQKAYYSNYGEWVDFTATGGDASKNTNILSTVVGGYGLMQGTSMAAPHATGSTALVVSKFQGQGFTRDNLLHILKSTVNSDFYQSNLAFKGLLGYGLIDTYAAVSFQDKAPAKVTDFKGKVRGNTVTLNWSVPGDVPAREFVVYESKSPLTGVDPANPGSGVKTYKIAASEHKPGTELGYGISDLEWDAEYYFAVASRNLAGQYSELSEQLKFKILPNQAPVIEAQTETDIAIRAHERAVIKFKLTDPEESELSYSLSPEHKGISHYMSAHDMLTIEIDALSMQDGQTYTSTLTVSDGEKQSTAEIKVEILKNNSPEPTAAIPDMVLNSLTDQQTIDMSKHFTDLDGEQLSYSYRLAPSSTIVKASATGDNFTVSAYSYGTCVMTVTATDAIGKSASSSFKLLVRDDHSVVDVYPNPVVDKLNIRTPQDATVSVRLVNKLGAELFSSESLSVGPFKPYSYDMSSQPSGEYYLSIEGQGVDERVTVIKK